MKEEEVEMDHCACVYRFFSLCVYKFTACACMFKCEAGYAWFGGLAVGCLLDLITNSA